MFFACFNLKFKDSLTQLIRSVKGFTPEHYSLPTSAGDLGLISAVGDSVELAYHKSRVGGTITLLPTKVPLQFVLVNILGARFWLSRTAQ